jgi:hypothetical protein
MWPLVIKSDILSHMHIEQAVGSVLHSHRPENVKPDKIKLNCNNNLKVNDMSTLGELWTRSDMCDERPRVGVWTPVPTFIPCVHIAQIHISFSACFHNPLLFLLVDTDAILITLCGRLTAWCHSATDTYSLTWKLLLNGVLLIDTKVCFAKPWVAKFGRAF